MTWVSGTQLHKDTLAMDAIASVMSEYDMLHGNIVDDIKALVAIRSVVESTGRDV